jgi:hypothetical protein
MEIQGDASTPTKNGESMAQNHYVSKNKRRVKNRNRKDPSRATMATLRRLAAEEAKRSAK